MKSFHIHSLHLSATFTIHNNFSSIGLQFVWQPYPLKTALYAVSVRQTRGLPPTSFRFHLTVDTLVLGYVFPTTKAH